MNRAIRKELRKPKYIISDKGPQFWCDGYKKWAESGNIKLRFGAIGQHGSIAVIERFFKNPQRRIPEQYFDSATTRKLSNRSSADYRILQWVPAAYILKRPNSK